MMRAAAALLILANGLVFAETPVLNDSTTAQLSGQLRQLLLQKIPNPLYEASRNWGQQSEGKRIRLGRRQIDVIHGPRNDGVWRKIRVEAINPADTLVLELRSVQRAPDGRLTFQIFGAVDIKFTLNQQRWLAGLKLLDAEVRGKARVRITLDCEAKSRFEAAGALPDIVIDVHVVRADFNYENLKFEHIAGIGGEAAEIIGDAAHSLLKQWRPSIERDLLSRANAAIVKAGEHKEVRLSLAKLFKK